MSKPIEQRLYDLEISPPPGAWNAISSALTQLDASSEKETSERLYQMEIEPPEYAWQQISQKLSTAIARVIKFNPRRLAAAAVILGLIATATYYFLNDSKTPAQLTTSLPASNETTTKTQPEQKPESADVKIIPPNATASVVGVSNLLKRKQSQKSSAPVAIEIVNESNKKEPEYYVSNTTLGDITSPQPNVEAPPIRDEQGNILMNMDLVGSADKRYIIVTGPNGEQTKISAKFEKFIPYLNSGMAKEDYTNLVYFESTMWKIVFDNWRNRLLANPSFAPSAGNFLDILELKKLIEENQ